VPGYSALLARNPDFRLVWLADLVSFFGDWFNTVAVYSIILRLSGTGEALAGVLIVRTLPAFLVAPIAGPLIDRFDRRRLMIASNLMRAVGSVGLLWARETGSLTVLLAWLTWMMCWTGIYAPAKSAVIPMLTDRRELPVANALAGGTWSIMLAVGAAVGGWATALFGEGWALAVDGATFVVAAGFLLRLPALAPQAAGRAVASRARAGFVDGLRYVAKAPVMAALVAIKPMMSLAAGTILVLPLFGDGIFAATRGPLYIGLLYAARGVGAIVGSMVIRTLVGDAPRVLRRMVLAGFVLSAVGNLALGVAPSFMIAAMALAGAAVGSGVNWVFSGTLIQIYGDPAYHGRLFALEFGTMTLLFSAVSWLAGRALDVWGFGARDIATASGLLMLVSAVIWLAVLVLFRRAHRRRAAPAPGRALLTDTFEMPVLPPETLPVAEEPRGSEREH
jgi:MFS family permease